MPGIISPTADFSASGLGRGLFLTTNRTNLISEFLFGRNLATSRVNSAGMKANAAEALTGAAVAPVYGDHEAELGNGAGIDTLVAMPGVAHTMLLVCGVQGADAATLATDTILSGVSSGFNGRLAVTVAAGKLTFSLADVSATPASLPNLPARPLSAHRCLIASISGSAAASIMTIEEFAGGQLLQSASAPTAGARTAPAGTIVVGNSSHIGPGTFPARVKHAARLDWDRQLSAAERLAAYQEVRAILAGMGKTI